MNASSADTANARPSNCGRPVVAPNGGANKAIKAKSIIHTGTTAGANNRDMAVTFFFQPRRTSVGAKSTYGSHAIRDFSQQPHQQCHGRANQENHQREQPDHKQQHQRIVEQSQERVERTPCVAGFSRPPTRVS